MDTIGVTIRRLRRWRGISLEQAAGLAGLSKGYLSKIENGQAPVERRSTLIAIANALRVSLTDITGDGLEIRDPEADSTIPDIRSALVDHDLDEAVPTQGELSALTSEAQLLAALRQANEDAQVGKRLPTLLSALHTHTHASEGLRSLVTATHTTTLLTKGLGAPDLAWIAADRGYQAAVRLDEPEWVALAEFSRTQALSGLGAHHRADRLARHGLDTVPEHATDIRGALTLTTGYTQSVLGGDTTDALDEAAELAEHSRNGNEHHLLFTPANVVLWRISATLESGDHTTAAALADTINPDQFPIASRRTSFFIEHARALHGLRRDDETVITLLLRAETTGPLRTRSNAFVREIINTLLTRSRTPSVSREARAFADRIGLSKPT